MTTEKLKEIKQKGDLAPVKKWNEGIKDDQWFYIDDLAITYCLEGVLRVPVLAFSKADGTSFEQAAITRAFPDIEAVFGQHNMTTATTYPSRGYTILYSYPIKLDREARSNPEPAAPVL